MDREVKLVICEDDEGHALLIRKNLERAGVRNEMLHFYNGLDALEFFFSQLDKPHQNPTGYILLLDIKMPKVDGMEVLKTLKSHPVLKKIPVIILTTTDNPNEIEMCHQLGCNSYIIKPVNYDKFMEVVNRLGTFLNIVKVPHPS